MATIYKSAVLSFVFALLIALSVSAPARASGLMAACAADISSLCSGIKEGRGRISACLYSHENKVSADCKPELSKVTSSRMFERMIPHEIQQKNDTPYEAGLREICASDIKSLCSDVKPGEDRLLACLYGWSNRVTKACQAEAKTALDHLKD
ncbi:MAG: cysteine rich repeat-containing protein [Pseudomonadota bacterium]